MAIVFTAMAMAIGTCHYFALLTTTVAAEVMFPTQHAPKPQICTLIDNDRTHAADRKDNYGASTPSPRASIYLQINRNVVCGGDRWCRSW